MVSLNLQYKPKNPCLYLSNSSQDILFSVIVPVYNVENYLYDCVQSVIEQNSTRTEIILVNDCSTDKSGEICNSLAEKHKNLQVIHNKTNQGVSISRNDGIKVAIGQYIVFLDSDDYLMENGLSGIGKIIPDKGYPDVIVIKKFLTRREPASFTTHQLFDDRIDSSGTPDDVIRNFNSSKNFYGNCWCHIVKRSVLIQNELFFTPNASFAEDQEFVAKLFCVAESFDFYRGTFYCKRSGSGTLTHKLNYDTSVACLKIINGLCEFLKVKKLSDMKRDFLYARIQSPLAQFTPQLINLNRSEVSQLSKTVEEDFKYLEVLENISRDFNLFFFTKTFGSHLGLLLYKQSAIEEIMLLLEEIGHEEFYIFSNNIFGKAVARLILNEGYPVKGILDNDETVAGTFFSGLELNSPSILRDRPADETAKISVLICNQHKNSIDAIYKQLRDIGLQKNRVTHKSFHPQGATI